MIIVVDEPKRKANLQKHGFDLTDASLFDWPRARIIPVRDGRLKAIGTLGDATVSLIFRRLGSEGLAIISLRPASRRERILYEQR